MTNEQMQAKIYELDSKIKAISKLISSGPNTDIDVAKLQSFIDKYAMIKALSDESTMAELATKITELNSQITSIQQQLQTPAQVIENEAKNISKIFEEDNVSLALTLNDVKMFKSQFLDSLKNLYSFIENLDFSRKVSELESKLGIINEMINDFRNQQEKIQEIINTNLEQEAQIEEIKAVNLTQKKQIDFLNGLLVQIEKQIESYAFFTEEFNKLYLTAKDFVASFQDDKEKIERLNKNFNLLIPIVSNIKALMEIDYKVYHNYLSDIGGKIDKIIQTVDEWLNHSLMFVNEVKAYNLALNAYNDELVEIGNIVNQTQAVLTNWKG